MTCDIHFSIIRNFHLYGMVVVTFSCEVNFFSINMSKEVLTGIAAKRFRQLFRCCSVKCILRIFLSEMSKVFFCMIFFAKLLLTKRISDHAHTVLAFEVTSYLFFGRSLVVKMVLYSTYKTVEYVQKFKQLIILP